MALLRKPRLSRPRLEAGDSVTRGPRRGAVGTGDASPTPLLARLAGRSPSPSPKGTDLFMGDFYDNYSFGDFFNLKVTFG